MICQSHNSHMLGEKVISKVFLELTPQKCYKLYYSILPSIIQYITKQET